MENEKRLKLSFWRAIDHYFIVIFLLLFPAWTLYSLFEIYVTGTYDGVRTGQELITTSFPFLIVAIVFYFIQKRRLRFKEVHVNYTDQEFKEAIDRTAKEYEWQIEYNNKRIFRAYRPWNWTGSWGEMITIIHGKETLLLNSICDPNKMSSIVSYGWNRKNIQTFLKNLIDVKNNIPVKEKVEISEKEWTLKRTIIRIIAYPVCLMFIVIGIYAILNPVNWKSQGAGIGAIIISSAYLYSDIKLIKMSRSKKHDPTTKNIMHTVVKSSKENEL